MQEALTYLKPGLGLGIDWCGLVQERPFDNQYTLTKVEESSNGISLSLAEDILIFFPQDTDMNIEKISSVIINITVQPISLVRVSRKEIVGSPHQKIEIRLFLQNPIG